MDKIIERKKRFRFKAEGSSAPEPTGERGWRYYDGSEAATWLASGLSTSNQALLTGLRASPKPFIFRPHQLPCVQCIPWLTLGTLLISDNFPMPASGRTNTTELSSLF